MKNIKPLTKREIVKFLQLINEKLAEQGQFGKIVICGGAAMTLAYNARNSTYDIDALYKPKDAITDIIALIAVENRLGSQWLNDDVSIFTSELKKLTTSSFLALSNLTVDIADAECLLTMKLISAREDSHDLHDAAILIKHLGINSVEDLNVLLNDYDGVFHPKSLLISKEFAKAAFAQSKLLHRELQDVSVEPYTSVLEQIASDRKKRKTNEKSPATHTGNKKKNRNDPEL